MKFTNYESKELMILYFKFCSDIRTMKRKLKHEQYFIVKTSQQTRKGRKHHFLLQNELRGAEVHTSVTPGIHPGVFGFHCHVLVSVSDTGMGWISGFMFKPIKDSLGLLTKLAF